ncbi:MULTISPECIES: hypothetical protein [unclassified Mesorhizobium]|uniref:hypothetical protein n=1 Tax=unclassified Mesorhizobium TaxID=325217 RepID=UPI0030153044
MTEIEHHPQRRIWAFLGYAALVIALPVALMGLLPANEYKAWGGDGIDCDGPGLVFFFAGLGLVLYGAGAFVNGRHLRKPFKLVVACACLLVCLALGVNLVAAVKEQRLNDAVPEMCG